MTTLQDGAAWFADRVKEQAGRTITYSRGATSGDLTAWVSHDDKEIVNAMGFPIKVQVRSYKCELADLPLTDPQAGDLISETIDGTVYTYIVKPPDDNTDAVEWVDQDGRIRVIHTGIYSVA